VTHKLNFEVTILQRLNISKIAQERVTVTMPAMIGSRTMISNGAIFNDLNNS